MGEEEGDIAETPSIPQLQTPLASELDIMPYTPPQVKIFPKKPLKFFIPHSFFSPNKQKKTPAETFYHIRRRDFYFSLVVFGIILEKSLAYPI